MTVLTLIAKISDEESSDKSFGRIFVKFEDLKGISGLALTISNYFPESDIKNTPKYEC